MPIVVTVALRFKPGLVDAFWLDVLPNLQAETRRFPGVLSVRALRKESNSTEVLFLDVFENTAASDAYFAWRRFTGTLAELEALLEEAPQFELWARGIGDEWANAEQTSNLKG